MIVKNNNTSIIRELAKNSYIANKSRNRLLIGAFAFAVVLLFSISSISIAQVDSEYMMYARSSGTLATVYMERPTMEQYKLAKELDCIDIVGKESYVMTGKQGEHILFTGKVVDAVAYEELYKPAYTDVYGHYPKKINEVMLPVSVIEQLEIDPKIGDAVVLPFYVEDTGEIQTQEFILSGYFSEYVDTHLISPSAFFSNAYLEASGRTLNDADVLVMKQQDDVLFEEIEFTLYENIPTVDETQQFIATDSLSYASVEMVYGGYDTAIFLAAVIAMSVILLVNNIMQISLEKSVREFGLLRTIGTTKKQLFQIQWKQIVKVILVGTLVGSVIAYAIVQFVFPYLLAGFVSGQGVAMGEVIQARLWLLLAILLFVALISILSMLFPLRIMHAISPKDALYFTYGKYRTRKKEIHSKTQVSLRKMAMRNISQNRGKFFKTIFSLFMASLLCIGSIMAIQILDYSDIYEGDPAFEFTNWSMLGDMDIQAENAYFNSEFLQDISEIDSVTSLEYSYQAYGRFNKNDKVWQPLLEVDNRELEGDEYIGGFRIVRDEELEQLETFLKENDIEANIDSFASGESVFNLDQHSFSKKMKEKAKKVEGETLHVYNQQDEEIGAYIFAGYLDLQTRGFPKFKNMSSNQQYMPYVLISEQGFAKLNIEKTISKLEVFVEEGQDMQVHNTIQKIMVKRNKTVSMESLQNVSLSVTYLAKEEAHDYIQSVKILLYSMSFILMAMSVFNYFNVMHTSLTNRRRELVLLESIGMTRSQLRGMLVWEGCLYSTVIYLLLVSIGSGVLYAISYFIQRERNTIQFTYPIEAMIVFMVVIGIVSIALPLYQYKKIEKQSLVERLTK